MEDQRLASLETRVEALERQIKAVRRENHVHHEYIDTVTSPLWKRVVWWFQGFYFRKVGRWYAQDWTPGWPR